MSERFRGTEGTSRFVQPFQLEEIAHVNVDKFETIERAAIERVITQQQELVTSLQTDVLDVRSERNALEHQLTKLETSREQLQDRIRELEADRPALEPKAVFSTLGAALESVDEDLSGERYRVDDVDFTLKTNVIQTDDGIRMHLPSLDETSASANLSEVSFRLRAPRDEAEPAGSGYTEVPDLRGLPHETAARRLAGATLTVGTVERIEDPGAQPGTVLEQFPEPYAVAEPEAPVDLVLAEDPEDVPEDPEDVPEEDTPSETESRSDPAVTTTLPRDESSSEETGSRSEDDEPEPNDETRARFEDDERARMEAFRRAIIETDPESGPEVLERLRRAGVDDLESLIHRDPEELAERLSIPVDRIVSLQELLAGHLETVALEDVSGIGSTYADRLRKEGIHTVSQLAELDPVALSEITNASAGRTADWIEQAKRMLRRE